MNTTNKQNKQIEILSELQSFRGTTKYYRLSPLFSFFHLTDGTHYLAESCGAHWLFELIASYQHDPKVLTHRQLQELQFWELKVTDSSAIAVCNWDKGQEVLRQEISYTDFPLKSIQIWVARLFLSSKDIAPPPKWVAYLPSEH